MADKEDVMGTQEVARTLGVSVRTVQLWVEKGLLRAWKTAGGHRRIARESVTQLLRARGSGGGSQQDQPALSILVVEDDLTMQAYYSALIEILRPDANVHLAADGFHGLIELGRITPQLMLVDVDMPGMDGIQMLRSIQELRLPNPINTAVVTSLSQDELQQRGRVPDGIPVFAKPLSADDLSLLLMQVENSRSSEAKQQQAPTSASRRQPKTA